LNLNSQQDRQTKSHEKMIKTEKQSVTNEILRKIKSKLPLQEQKTKSQTESEDSDDSD